MSQADRIEQALAQVLAKQAEQTAAINSVGSLVQWIVDNVKDVFAFIASPQLAGMLSGMPMMMQQMQVPDVPDEEEDDEDDDDDSAGTDDDGPEPGTAVADIPLF